MKIYSNIVPQSIVRDTQRKTLEVIADALSNSFGPKGSTTAIVKHLDPNEANISIEYTKDGHTIVKSMMFMGTIERSVQDLLTELTRYVVKEVGDGTTSAVILCKTVFDALCDNENIALASPSDTLHTFHEVIEEINKRILELGRECTIEDIYNIALISTNNNEEISKTLLHIYERYGLDVYIDVGISNEVDNIVKEYDGMTLDTGFTDICFVNDKATNTSKIIKPNIYCFNDPIDTPEMLGFLDAILEHNILRCYRPNSVYEPIPTVILAKKITPDSSSYFETVVKLMNQYPGKIPLLIVSDIHQDYLYEDIAQMCGARFIKKYISQEIQQKDVEAGIAPTLENVWEFCGHADEVRSDQLKTQVIRPAKMFNEDGTKSDDYNTMLNYLETQINKAINDDAGVNEIARTKRRYNSFKGNMIDFLIGGVTLADREALKSSVEDAVLNCRSAAVNGVGYGANFMAFKVLSDMKNNDPKWSSNAIVGILYTAYVDLIKILYTKSFDASEIIDILDNSLKYGCPLNIRTNEYDKAVLSSIKSDTIVLDTIDKILALMYTTNQYLVPTPAHNMYVAELEAKNGTNKESE